MQNLLTVLNLSMLVLLAGLPDRLSDARWWLVAVGATAAVLLWRLARHERRAERQEVQSAIWDDVLTAASSALRRRSGPSADHRRDSQ